MRSNLFVILFKFLVFYNKNYTSFLDGQIVYTKEPSVDILSTIQVFSFGNLTVRSTVFLI